MKQIYSSEGRRRLRASWLLLAASFSLSAAFIAGSIWYLEREKGTGLAASKRLAEADRRLQAVQRERESLEHSAAVFRRLQARGGMQPERRLELVELMKSLRAEHRITSVDYEIAPQRPLALATGAAYAAVDVRASRVKLRLRALHEGDVLAFIEALAAAPQGFHPVDRCVMRRIEGRADDPLHPRVEAECTLEWITVVEKRNA
jgi:hypothetical protein